MYLRWSWFIEIMCSSSLQGNIVSLMKTSISGMLLMQFFHQIRVPHEFTLEEVWGGGGKGLWVCSAHVMHVCSAHRSCGAGVLCSWCTWRPGNLV